MTSAKVVPASSDHPLKRLFEDSYFFLIALAVLATAETMSYLGAGNLWIMFFADNIIFLPWFLLPRGSTEITGGSF